MKKLRILIASTFALAAFQSPQAQAPAQPQAAAAARPAPVATAGEFPAAWRPTVYGKNGMVTAGHPAAAEAGMRILQQGGNAIDAAIATWAMQGVVEPPMTGLGADMFIIMYEAKTKSVKVINATGVAPQQATIEYYKAHGGITGSGPLATSVPGAVAGAVLAVEKFGTKPLSQIWAPAIDAAENGIPLNDNLGNSIRGAAKLLGTYESTRKIYFRDGKPLGPGDIFYNKDLAKTMRLIAEKGRAGFYEGPVAKMFADYSASQGGIITEADLASIQAEIQEPVKVNYRGVDVYAVGPNSQGFVTLEALNILEGFNLKYMGHNSAQYLHVITESLKLAMSDRNKYVGDPKFIKNIPMAELLSKEYAAERRKMIDPHRALLGEPPSGNPTKAPSTTSSAANYAWNAPMPALEGTWTHADEEATLGLTTYLNVIDKDQNMVSITSSILSSWGNGMVVEGAGFLTNNRMNYFYDDPNDVNALVPGKRTRQTINPQLAIKDGKPWMVFGTPGADTQPQCQLQFFLNYFEFGMGVQQALEQPAVISSSFRSSSHPHRVAGRLLTPSSLPEATKIGLAALGHDLDIRPARGVGSVKAIVINQETGALMGGVSPSGGSYVMGW
jgi:gamma-glutamyltranspeptidase / glutathione hydrolase